MEELELHKGKFYRKTKAPCVLSLGLQGWNANPELDMPEFGVKSKDREFQWCYLSCDEDLK